MLNFFSFFGLLVAIGGAAGAFTRVISPNLGIYLILGGIAWMAVLMIPALLRTMKWGRRDMPAFALYAGLLAFASAGGLAYRWYQNPLNDLTTNVNKPPLFTRPVYLFQPKNGAEFLDKNFELDRSYPSNFAGKQSIRYNGLETITASLPLEDAAPVVERTIKQRFPEWRIVSLDKASSHIEAELENPFLRNVDDLAVEVQSAKNKLAVTNVDFRIRNRFPYGDFGLTTARMNDLRQALQSALEGAAAKYAAFQKNYAKPVTPPSGKPEAPAATPTTAPAPERVPEKL